MVSLSPIFKVYKTIKAHESTLVPLGDPQFMLVRPAAPVRKTESFPWIRGRSAPLLDV